MSKSFCSFVAVPLLAALLPAQVDPQLAARIKEEGLQRSQVMAILDHLTNSIGQRLTGSDNFTLACEWTKAEFERMGLKNVHLDEWGEFPVIWNRGQWQGRVLTPEPIELQVATEAWTAGTKGRVSGTLRPMPKTAEDVAALSGLAATSYFWGSRPSSAAVRRAFDALVQKEGCLGFVARAGAAHPRFPTRMRVFGNHRVNPNNLPTIPNIVVRQDQAARIEELLRGPDAVTIEFDIRNRFRAGPVKLHNVVAEIPGTEFPDQVVIVCGHLDSWHMATGTTDNGTGTASTMEAARILAAVGAKPRRTIRFILWGGEEQGLLGSNSYVRRNRTSMNNVSAVFNHDTGTNWAQGLTVTPSMVDDLKLALAEIESMTPPEPDAGVDGDREPVPVLELTVADRMPARGGSDHASFLAAGVPAWSWTLKGRSDYFNYTWHTQWDTFDIAIPEYMRHTSTVVALAALGTANLPNLIARDGVMRAVGTDATPVLEAALGVELDGMTFKSVKPDGRAATAGIRDGDVVTHVNGEEVTDFGRLMRALRPREGAEPPRLTLKRGSGEASVVLEPVELPRQPRGEGRPERTPERAPERPRDPVIR
jgi:carboxypeptidase Q